MSEDLSVYNTPTTPPQVPGGEEKPHVGPWGIALRVLLPLLVLGLAYFAFDLLSIKEALPPPPQQQPRLLETRAKHVAPADYPVMLETQGIVQVPLQASITPQVNGRLSQFSKNFEPGIFVAKGTLLAELDPVDFQAELARAEANLARSEAALAQEEARARQARRNWEELDFDEEPSPLVLREPQLREARANLVAAHADLEQAKLSLERTKILAPFDGIVLDRLVGIGERTGPGTSLGTLAATGQAEVRLPLSPRQLALLDPEAFEEQRPVTFSDALNPDLVTTSWQGRLIRPEGRVDESTREVFVIARIDDPFGRESNKPALRIGMPVRASFRATTFDKVVAIPREAMQSVSGVIEVTGGVIKKHKIAPIWTTPSELVVRDQFAEGADLAINQLPFAPEGREIKILEPSEEDPESDQQIASP